MKYNNHRQQIWSDQFQDLAILPNVYKDVQMFLSKDPEAKQSPDGENFIVCTAAWTRQGKIIFKQLWPLRYAHARNQ